jgi:general secretion pathway protein G
MAGPDDPKPMLLRHGRQRGAGGINFLLQQVDFMRNRSLIRASRRSAQRGFSLIEIILVVVLIGGIVAFAATRILGGGDRARVNLAKAQVQTLAEKVQQFEMDTGSLPNSLEELVSQPGNAGGWLGPYAKPAELNDPWNTPFEYRIPGDAQSFDIISLGADRKPGGDSVNADIKYQ